MTARLPDCDDVIVQIATDPTAICATDVVGTYGTGIRTDSDGVTEVMLAQVPWRVDVAAEFTAADPEAIWQAFHLSTSADPHVYFAHHPALGVVSGEHIEEVPVVPITLLRYRHEDLPYTVHHLLMMTNLWEDTVLAHIRQHSTDPLLTAGVDQTLGPDPVADREPPWIPSR